MKVKFVLFDSEVSLIDQETDFRPRWRHAKYAANEIHLRTIEKENESISLLDDANDDEKSSSNQPGGTGGWWRNRFKRRMQIEDLFLCRNNWRFSRDNFFIKLSSNSLKSGNLRSARNVPTLETSFLTFHFHIRIFTNCILGYIYIFQTTLLLSLFLEIKKSFLSQIFRLSILNSQILEFFNFSM